MKKRKKLDKDEPVFIGIDLTQTYLAYHNQDIRY